MPLVTRLLFLCAHALTASGCHSTKSTEAPAEPRLADGAGAPKPPQSEPAPREQQADTVDTPARVTPINPQWGDVTVGPLPKPPPKMPFVYPSIDDNYEDSCTRFFVQVRYDASQRIARALVAEATEAYRFQITNERPTKPFEVQLGLGQGDRSSGPSNSTKVLAACFDNETCEVLAGVLAKGVDSRAELNCGTDSTGMSFSEVWTKESLEKAQLARTEETADARLYYCVAYEFGWINGGDGGASRAVLDRCAAKKTCLEVAQCIEPYEQGRRSQVRPIRRPRD